MKFQVNDLVRKDDGRQDLYTIIATRTYEPCCLLQQQSNTAAKNHWAISEELQLLSNETQRSEAGHPVDR